jgi:N-acetylneuraminate synthase
MRIGQRDIGAGHPVYVVAELSANHHQRVEEALKLVDTAADAGADAVKLQTYTADTLTIDCDKAPFRIARGTLWEGKTLYQLYREAYTPWEWHGQIKEAAERRGLAFFSTPFDGSAIQFLETLGVPCYKIASFEIVDLPLITRAAATRRPLIMSTGMATLAEIGEAVRAARDGGATAIALLKCTSGYPANPREMNLRTIPHLAAAFGLTVGLSDHTLGIAVPIAAVALGATIIEKHLTLSRSDPGPDSAFSLEPHEFKAMVEAVRTAREALGEVSYALGTEEAHSRAFRRSLYVVRQTRAGEIFTEEHVRSIRPDGGLPPRYLPIVLGRRASRDIERGTPLDWTCVE